MAYLFWMLNCNNWSKNLFVVLADIPRSHAWWFTGCSDWAASAHQWACKLVQWQALHKFHWWLQDHLLGYSNRTEKKFVLFNKTPVWFRIHEPRISGYGPLQIIESTKCSYQASYSESRLCREPFCQVRSCNGQNDNPTFLHQQSTQNSIRLGQTTISPKSNASCNSSTTDTRLSIHSS